MGWLELLPLLKRLLPLLGRMAPMLEAYVGARGAVREDVQTSFDRFSDDLKGDFATAAQNHAEVKRALDEHSGHLALLTDDVSQLRASNALYGTRLEEMEKQLSSMSGLLRTVSVLTILLLIACVVLLTLLLLRH